MSLDPGSSSQKKTRTESFGSTEGIIVHGIGSEGNWGYHTGFVILSQPEVKAFVVENTTVVPEPSDLALGAAGLALLTSRRRRRKH